MYIIILVDLPKIYKQNVDKRKTFGSKCGAYLVVYMC